MGFNITNHDFFSDVFEKQKINALYSSVYNSYSGTNISKQASGVGETFLKSNIHTFKFVPDYLKTTVVDPLVCDKVFQKKGYAAFLNDYSSLDAYIDSNCKSNFRGNIRRPLKRLESCLNIKYVMYCGTMSLTTYTALMDTFHSMLQKRFQQLETRNLILENWNYYQKMAYDAINKKNASLFVMFNNEEPIAFSLNFHFDTIFYFAIPTFDLDYAKFTLGNLVIYKNLEWCFENNFKIFDMGYGGFENKINWCNSTYNYEHHVLYLPNNHFGKLHTVLLRNKYKLINYLISKNIHIVVRNLKNTLKRKKVEAIIPYSLSKIENSERLPDHELLKIDLNHVVYHHLKKPLYDFLYLNNEHFDDVSVYKINNAQEIFLIKGKKNMAKTSILNITQ